MADCQCFKEVLEEINEQARWEIMASGAGELRVQAKDVTVDIAGIVFRLVDIQKTMQFCPWCGERTTEKLAVI